MNDLLHPPTVPPTVITMNVDSYESVFEEIEAICTERLFNARSERLMLYHDIGRILSEKEAEGYGTTELVNRLSVDERLRGKEMGERNLWFALALFRAYPDVSALPEGKNCSVGKMKKLLMAPKVETLPDFEDIALRIFTKYGKDAERIYYFLGELIANEAHLAHQA